MTISSIKLREKILAERGLHKAHKVKKRGRLVRNSAEAIVVPPYAKTDKMRYLETKYGKPIEELLLSGSLQQVVKKLNGEVDFTTVSKWIKKLKLRYSKTNLPNCYQCLRWAAVCQAGYCSILGDLGENELLLLKKEELLKGKLE